MSPVHAVRGYRRSRMPHGGQKAPRGFSRMTRSWRIFVAEGPAGPDRGGTTMRKILPSMLLLATMAVLDAAPANAAQPQSNYPPDLDLTASVWSVIDGNVNVVTLANDASGGLYLDVPVMPDTTCQSSKTCASIMY